MTAIPLETLVTVFGGSGFLGRHVVRALAKLGYRIRVAVRRPELAGFLQPLGQVGQIHAVQANVRHPASVEAAARDADVRDMAHELGAEVAVPGSIRAL
ncbi:MAG: NmrA family NAD(P)-binding protein, partial [Acidobacteria bacterium Pan2503]|nr:NmrA family NAD(P)-binding protein [Candidatus Acidoferrum panamensis]